LRFAFVLSNQLVTPQAKLRQLSDNVVAAVVVCVCAAAVAAAIFAGFYFFLYLQDVYDIVKTRHVKTIVGHLTSIQYNAFTWWCLTDVWVRKDGSLQTYQLFFYPTHIEEDSDYVMNILPRSTTILSLERCPSR
jgi:cytochrome c oxidase assembly factor CtaG